MMELKMLSLDGNEAGAVTLNKDIFGLEPRADLIHRCVVWQLANRPYRQETRGAEGHRRRASRLASCQPVPRRRPFVRSGRAQP
jgi:large subunit ribosomal protein L4